MLQPSPTLAARENELESGDSRTRVSPFRTRGRGAESAADQKLHEKTRNVNFDRALGVRVEFQFLTIVLCVAVLSSFDDPQAALKLAIHRPTPPHISRTFNTI